MSRSRDRFPWPQALKHGVNLCHCQMCIQSRQRKHVKVVMGRKQRKDQARDVAEQIVGYAPGAEPDHPDYNACADHTCDCAERFADDAKGAA